MADISATNPVVVPASGTMTYDKWYLTQLLGKIDPEHAMLTVHLNRAALVDGQWNLMPRSQNSEISFTLDAWKEISSTPEIAAAINSIVSAVVAYATKKNLL